MTDQRNDEFPDQLFLNHVRDALWRRPGQASVMIGSGFSRNARKNRPDAPDIPLWQDLADALAKNLSRDNPKGEHARHEPAADRVLDLAQKYKDSFGRTRLHQFLVESVRDEDFCPGELHHRLLELPWCDVFTTNWGHPVGAVSSGTRAGVHPGDVEESSAGLPISPHRKAARIHSWDLPAHRHQEGL